MKKRVLICCTYWEPNISGVTVYAKHMYDVLQQKGFEIRVLTSDHIGIGDEKNIKRSKVMFRFGKGVFMPNWLFDSWREVRMAEIVNIHLPNLEGWMVALWAKVLNKKIIVTHHCEFGFSGNQQNKLISVVSFVFHGVCYLLADKVIAYTEDYALFGSFFLRLFRKKIDYCLPPVIVGKEDKEFTVALKNKLKKNKKYVGFAGRISWEKGIEFLCRAAADNTDIQLVFAGPYTGVVGDNTFENLKKQFDLLINKPVFLGSLNRDQLVSFYKTIDCLVLPSTDNLETFGIVQAEAMLCGTPVVASNLPGVRVPVRMTGMGEIAKVGNFKDLAKKIKIVLGKKYINRSEVFNLEEFKKFYAKILADN